MELSFDRATPPTNFLVGRARFSSFGVYSPEQWRGQYPSQGQCREKIYQGTTPQVETISDVAALKELPAGTRLLRNQYQIERTLMEGGFGITYLARDSLERQVVIKECFPEVLCYRSELSVKTRSASQNQTFRSVMHSFLKEARRLAKLQHPNIVNVHQVFEENGTAYLAMDHVDGVDLFTLHEDNPEKLTRETLQRALCDLLKALAYIHGRGVLHRDISPDNIMLDDVGRVTLIDFGAARDNYMRRDRALTALLAVKDGYSPHEFYLDETDQQASSDLYSLAATFYHLVSGEAPPDSQTRVSALASGKLDPYQRLIDRPLKLDPIYLETIDRCLNISQRDRIQSAEDWLRTLKPGTVHSSPSTESPLELNEALVGSITALVEATNLDVKTAEKETCDHTEPKTPPQVGPKDNPVRQFVDIFGNPIDDVDDWLLEQDTLLSARNNESSALSSIDANNGHGGKNRSGARGAVAAFLARVFRYEVFDTSIPQLGKERQ